MKWGSYRVSYTYSKALDNVGEFFFSAPINNFNIWQDYGRSDDDQRHRLVFDGTIHSPAGTASSDWERISHGFQLTAMLQYYSALPFNITTGANTIQGTAARPTINGVFINRNAGSGFDSLSVGARLSRSFQITERLRLEGLAEGVQPHQSRQRRDLERRVRHRRIPIESIVQLRPGHRGQRSAIDATGAAAAFLRRNS